ncbi:MAG: hypothetical protein JWQ25_2164 [Daejeonella sp.]|nr:hypothetical protein [Daejeonella sp.]
MEYSFSTLSDKDLEVLARDVLSKKLAIHFQSFKMGKDKGIDLRYATINDENEIIVQVKQFVGSGVTKLKNTLKKKELSKVVDLNPKRYILVTSLSLNPQNKEDIKRILSPYIHSTDDVLGRDELNSFLRTNPEIEEAHFKLWLTSTTVLKRILKNGVKGRSEFLEDKIKRRVEVFVPSKTHEKAIEILNNKKFIVITGAPGIGKTTLADMITYQLLAEDFELVYIREIIEAEDVFKTNKKQVFYFDDFLGSITLDLSNSKDTSIVNFIERVTSDKQKRLILTCRTTFLNQAKEESDKIYNSKIEIANYEVKIEDLRNIDKAHILYNHVYFSNLPEKFKNLFFKNKFYWKIIKHRNYNPRIVEFFTDFERLERGIDYNQEVLDILGSPVKLWEKHYTKQISDNARLFVATLFSLGSIVEEERIKEAFKARIDYETLNNNYVRKSNLFNKVVEELLLGLITRTHIRNGDYSRVEYKLLNPSIEDFLHYYFSFMNTEEYVTILKSAKSFEQFKGRITTKKEENVKKIYFGEDNYRNLLEIFQERLPYLKSYLGSKELETVVILINLFRWIDIKEQVIGIMNSLNIKYLNWHDREHAITILDYLAEGNLLNFFSFSIEELILKLSDAMPYYYQLAALSDLISKHEVYAEIIEKGKIGGTEFYDNLQSNINKFWERGMDYFIQHTYRLNLIANKNELIETIANRKEEAQKLNLALNINISPIINEYQFDYETQITKNIFVNLERETKIENFQDKVDTIDETVEINRLFNSYDKEEISTAPF